MVLRVGRVVEVQDSAVTGDKGQLTKRSTRPANSIWYRTAEFRVLTVLLFHARLHEGGQVSLEVMLIVPQCYSSANKYHSLCATFAIEMKAQ